MAARKNALKVVSSDEVIDSGGNVSARITDSLDGSTRDLLASMRLALAMKLDTGEISSNAIASAYKELREIDRQIRALDAEVEKSAETPALKDAAFDVTAI